MPLTSFNPPPTLSLSLASLLPTPVPRILFAISNEGHEPNEVVDVWKHLTKTCNWEVHFATETGLPAKPDEKLMQKSLFRSVFGAKMENVEGWYEMVGSRSWVEMRRFGGEEAGRVRFEDYDAVYLPGGHDKSMIPYLTSAALHSSLLNYLPQTVRHLSPLPTNPTTTTNSPNPPHPQRVLATICHGVLPLAFARYPTTHPDPTHAGKPLLHNLETSTFPMWMEVGIWGLSQAWGMGDYFRTFTEGNQPPETAVGGEKVKVGGVKEEVKTAGEKKEGGLFEGLGARFGAGGKDKEKEEKKEKDTTYTETIVQNALDDPVKQYKRGPLLPTPFHHTDPTYHYVSARFPGDTKELAAALVREICTARQRFADELAAGVYGDGSH